MWRCYTGYSMRYGLGIFIFSFEQIGSNRAFSLVDADRKRSWLQQLPMVHRTTWRLRSLLYLSLLHWYSRKIPLIDYSRFSGGGEGDEDPEYKLFSMISMYHTFAIETLYFRWLSSFYSYSSSCDIRWRLWVVSFIPFPSGKIRPHSEYKRHESHWPYTERPSQNKREFKY